MTFAVVLQDDGKVLLSGTSAATPHPVLGVLRVDGDPILRGAHGLRQRIRARAVDPGSGSGSGSRSGSGSGQRIGFGQWLGFEQWLGFGQWLGFEQWLRLGQSARKLVRWRRRSGGSAHAAPAAGGDRRVRPSAQVELLTASIPTALDSGGDLPPLRHGSALASAATQCLCWRQGPAGWAWASSPAGQERWLPLMWPDRPRAMAVSLP